MPTITINFAADELETVQDVLSMLNGRAELAEVKQDEPQGSIYDQIENARKTREEEEVEQFKANIEKMEAEKSADEPAEEKPKKTRTRRSKNPTQQEVKEAVKAAKASYGEKFCLEAACVVGASVENTLLKTIREMDKTMYSAYITQLNKGPSELPEICDSHEETPVNTTGSLFEESDNADTPVSESDKYCDALIETKFLEPDSEELAYDDDDWATDDEPEAEAEKVQIDPAGVQQALRAYAKKDRAAAREVLKASGAKTIGAVLELPQDKLLEIMKAVS